MADKTTGELQAVKVEDLPAAPDIYDDFKMPGELQGEAVHVTGAQMKQYAVAAGTESARQFTESVKAEANSAKSSAASAAKSAETAVGAKTAAQSALTGVQNAIKNIPAGSTLIVNDLTTGGTKAALSADMGKVLGMRPNPNLLHNWYFVNAVNQLKFTTGSANTTLGYAFDMWRRIGYSTGVITLSSDGMTIDSTATTAGQERMYQQLEKPLPTGIYTLSVFISEVSGTARFTMADTGGNPLLDANGRYASKDVTEPGVYSVTCANGSPGRVDLGTLVGSRVTIKAVKLECGAGQTLAYQDGGGNWLLCEVPNYAEELAKCQRYMMVYPMIRTAMMWPGVAWDPTQVMLCVPLPQPLRARPAKITNAADFALHDGTSIYPVTAMEVYSESGNSVTLRVYSTGLTNGQTYALRAAAATNLILDANL